MTERKPSQRAAREAVAQLGQLGQNERLGIADRKVCLMASEWLAQFHQLQSRLENAEAYLNDEVRRHETALASLSHRKARPNGPMYGPELLAHLRRLRAELETGLPATPRSVPFAATSV